MLSVAGCDFDDPCDGTLVFLNGTCLRCPADATYNAELDTCVCNQPEYYEYIPNSCVLLDGAMPPDTTEDTSE